jgi:hypothetical protein
VEIPGSQALSRACQEGRVVFLQAFDNGVFLIFIIGTAPQDKGVMPGTAGLERSAGASQSGFRNRGATR